MVRLKNQKQIELGIRNVVRLGYVSLFTDLSTEMILGVLPFFIIKKLGATAAILGIIEGLGEAVQRAIIPDYASVQLKRMHTPSIIL